MLSRSGDTCKPSTSTSSPTFPITVTSAGSIARTRPRRNRAPPTAPESATIRLTFRTLSPRTRARTELVADHCELDTRSAPLASARPDLHGRVHDRARHRDRERRAPVDRDEAPLLGRQPAVGD